MYLESFNKLELENNLQKVIDNFKLQVFYQPIVDLTNSKIVAFEAFLACQDPEKFSLFPSRFFPLAEKRKQILQINYWFLEQVCRQIGQWQDKYRTALNIIITINLSSVQLKNLFPYSSFDCLEKIKLILEKNALLPQSLQFQITETTILESFEIANLFFKKIKALGIKVSVANFNMSYSSLNYLNNFPIDRLKLDGSFIKSLKNNREQQELTKTIINLAQNINIKTIATGLATTEERDLLMNLNCQYGQGYLFSQPTSNKETEILIAIARRANSHFATSR